MTDRPTLSSQNIILSIIVLGYLMLVLDVSIVITALPSIKDELAFNQEHLTWVSNSYTLAFGGFLLLGARAGDLFGRKYIFQLGLLIFTFASLLIVLTPNATGLLAARALQGIGAAILAPSSLALLTTSFAEGKSRTRAVAYYGSVAGIGASLGLVLGGLLTSLISWRAGFFINLPIGGMLFFLANRYLVETPRQTGKIYILGALLSTLGMSSLVYSIVTSTEYGWLSSNTLSALVISVFLLSIFIVLERKVEQPILPLEIFSHKVRASAYLTRFFFLGGMIGFFFFMSLFLQTVYGFSPFTTGLAFLPMTLTNFFFALYVPKLTARWGNERLLIVGLFTTFAGMFWLSQLSPTQSSFFTEIALPMILIGIGQGASLSTLTVASMKQVPDKFAGAASGMMNVSHQLGGAVGLSLILVIFSLAKPFEQTPSIESHIILTHQVSAALMAGSGLLAIASLLALFFIYPSRKNA